jgi:hypothetical protein
VRMMLLLPLCGMPLRPLTLHTQHACKGM